MNFLIRSVRYFDGEGLEHEDEAIRMATNLRNLCYDAGRRSNSQGLLQQLDRARLIDLNALRFNDTAEPIGPDPEVAPGEILQRVVGHGQGLIGAADGDIFRWSPIYDARGRNFTLPFGEWWEREFITSKGVDFFSRGGLVKTMADQDGGAHVDPSVSNAYRAYYSENTFLRSISTLPPGPPPQMAPPMEAPIGNPAFATTRQVTHEMLTTLADQVVGHVGLTLQVPGIVNPFGPIMVMPTMWLTGTPVPPQEG